MATPHKPEPKVGVVDLAKMSHMFYEAGWWIAQAQSSEVLDKAAFANDWRVMTMHIVLPLTNFWHPTIQTVGSTEPDFKVHHNADVLGADMVKIFLERLHTQGPVAATQYAQAMQAQRDAAQAKLMGMYRQAANHDLALAQQADRIKCALSDTIIVCEVAMTVISCVITLGLAGPVVVGAAGAEVGWATFGISSSYAMAAQAVKDQPNKLDAVAVADAKQVDKKGINLIAGQPAALAKTRVATRLATYNQAVKSAEELNGRFLTARGPVAKAVTGVQSLAGKLNVAKTGSGLSVAQEAEKAAKGLKGGFAIVFAGLSIKQSIADWQSRDT